MSTTTYRVGEVWERDGNQRIITGIGVYSGQSPSIGLRNTEGLSSYHIYWRKKTNAVERRCWCGTWLDWVAKATLVKEAI